ncbi:MAG TPA: hypothetical protein VGU20_28100 [Stellaceae bacterium]|nr:hypothetical protein [Stellaceae bacterium]
MRASRTIAISWLALAGAFIAILAPLNIPTYLNLIRHGQKTTAEIRKLDCDNHARAEYAFTVVAAEVLSSDVMSTDCRSLRPGDKILVYYDTVDPTINRAREPVGGLVNELIPIALVCLTVPPLMISAVSRWTNRNKIKSS